jgi:hypothetical protein
LSVTVVSIIDRRRGIGRRIGAAGLAEDALDLGELRQQRSCVSNSFAATSTETPGSVVGI